MLPGPREVGQEPVLFNTSVAENVRYGAPEATQADLEAAADLANMNFVPRGLRWRRAAVVDRKCTCIYSTVCIMSSKCDCISASFTAGETLVLSIGILEV